jgi:hypothetical protein
MKKAKKKPAKKSAKDILIILRDLDGAVPTEATAKSNKPNGPGDKVRWSNETDRGLTLTFSAWPFVEPPQDIQIDAGDKSPKFTVYASGNAGRYGYSINPVINPAYGPPDSPAVILED